MAKAAAATLDNSEVKPVSLATQIALVVGASLFVALCARITLPLPFTPVPLTVQNFGVLLVGLLLGSRRGFAALALYLAEGAAGLPVFSLAGVGGIAQIFGITGGYLLAYPVAAFVAGWIAERGPGTFSRFALAALAGDAVIFAGGLAWIFALTHSVSQTIRYGLIWFVFAEVIKILFAAGIRMRMKNGVRFSS